MDVLQLLGGHGFILTWYCTRTVPRYPAGSAGKKTLDERARIVSHVSRDSRCSSRDISLSLSLREERGAREIYSIGEYLTKPFVPANSQYKYKWHCRKFRYVKLHVSYRGISDVSQVGRQSRCCHRIVFVCVCGSSQKRNMNNISRGSQGPGLPFLEKMEKKTQRAIIALPYV
jgi:hypothetical protein